MRCIGTIDLTHWTGTSVQSPVFLTIESYTFFTSLLFGRIVATAAWVIAWWIKVLPPYERDFSVHDALINHAHRKNQYVSLNHKSKNLTHMTAAELAVIPICLWLYWCQVSQSS